jgi:hypothetical protein
MNALLADIQSTPRDNSWLDLSAIMEQLESDLLQVAINLTRGDTAKAARLTKLNRTTFHEKCKKYGVTYQKFVYADEHLHKWQLYRDALKARVEVLERLVLGLREADDRRREQVANIIQSA